jgi:hypothetical protein
MSDPNRTPDAGTTGRRVIDQTHQRGETGRYEDRTPTPKDPVAHDLPGAVPGNTGIDDVGARMVPRGNAAGETDPLAGTSTEGASGGNATRDDDRKPKRV